MPVSGNSSCFILGRLESERSDHRVLLPSSPYSEDGWRDRGWTGGDSTAPLCSFRRSTSVVLALREKWQWKKGWATFPFGMAPTLQSGWLDDRDPEMARIGPTKSRTRARPDNFPLHLLFFSRISQRRRKAWPFGISTIPVSSCGIGGIGRRLGDFLWQLAARRSPRSPGSHRERLKE